MAGKHYQQLLEDIRSDALGADRLPSYRELARRYHCSVGAIKRSLDKLALAGIVRSVHGVGTFRCRGDFQGRRIPAQSERRVVGTVLLPFGFMEAASDMILRWQDDGWFIAQYDCWMDWQSPELEQQFLMQAYREGFSAVIIAATPLEPLNTALYRQLRQAGMKIVHIVPYKTDMSDEVFFMNDYRQAAQLGAAQLLRHGSDHLAVVSNGGSAPYLALLRQGFREFRSALGLPSLDEIVIDGWETGRPAEPGLPRRFETPEDARHERQSIRNVLARFTACPPGAGFLCASPDIAWQLRHVLREAGLAERYRLLSLESTGPHSRDVSGMLVDYHAILDAAWSYIRDGATSPRERVQQWFTPRLHLV